MLNEEDFYRLLRTGRVENAEFTFQSDKPITLSPILYNGKVKKQKEIILHNCTFYLNSDIAFKFMPGIYYGICGIDSCVVYCNGSL
jgi:hypothetical protein